MREVAICVEKVDLFRYLPSRLAFSLIVGVDGQLVGFGLSK
jgi:hypothetical protein